MHKLIFLSAILCCTAVNSNASSFYAGYAKTDEAIQVNNRELDFSASGNTLLLSLDLSGSWSANLDYTRLKDDLSVNRSVISKLETTSWSLGVSYFVKDWSLNLTYFNSSDKVGIHSSKQDPQILDRDSDSPAYALSISHSWIIQDWLADLNAGIYYSEWEQLSLNLNPKAQQINSSQLAGNSTFISLGASISRYFAINTDSSLILGIGASWNEKLDDDTTTLTRNGRDLSERVNRGVRNHRLSALVAGSQSYAQFNLFASYQINRQWVLELAAVTDTGGEDNAMALTTSLGYQF